MACFYWPGIHADVHPVVNISRVISAKTAAQALF